MTDIIVEKNPNFPQWFKILFKDGFGFEDIFDEVKGRAMAMRVAKRLAKKEKIDYVVVDGFLIETEEM
jgi:hypothetical protein